MRLCFAGRQHNPTIAHQHGLAFRKLALTRENYRNMGRITELIENNKMFEDLGVPTINPAEDRVMICGSPAMLRDLKRMLEERQFKEGNTTKPGDFVIERAFAEQ